MRKTVLLFSNDCKYFFGLGLQWGLCICPKSMQLFLYEQKHKRLGGPSSPKMGSACANPFHQQHSMTVMLDSNKYCKHDRHALLFMEKARTFITRRIRFFAGHVGKPFNTAKSSKIEGQSNTPTMQGQQVSAFLFPQCLLAEQHRVVGLALRPGYVSDQVSESLWKARRLRFLICLLFTSRTVQSSCLPPRWIAMGVTQAVLSYFLAFYQQKSTATAAAMVFCGRPSNGVRATNLRPSKTMDAIHESNIIVQVFFRITLQTQLT